VRRTLRAIPHVGHCVESLPTEYADEKGVNDWPFRALSFDLVVEELNLQSSHSFPLCSCEYPRCFSYSMSPSKMPVSDYKTGRTGLTFGRKYDENRVSQES